MYRTDTNMVIETFAEAYELFMYPCGWDGMEGSDSERCALLMIGLNPDRIQELPLSFATEEVSGYWYKLMNDDFEDFRLASFDFSTGTESNHSWTNRVIHRKNSSVMHQSYLQVAKHIATVGFSEFTFTEKEDRQSLMRVIEVTSKNGHTFKFEDRNDIVLFKCLEDWIDEQKRIIVRSEVNFLKEASLFCQPVCD